MRTIREEEVSEQIRKRIIPLQFTREEKEYIRKRVSAMRHDWTKQYDSQLVALELTLKAIDNRLDRLTDAYLDEAIERELFDHKKASLLLEKKRLEERLSNLKNNPGSIVQVLEDFLELAGSAYLRHEMALPEEKRDLLKDLTSNCIVDGKNVSMELKLPFNDVAGRMKYSNGAPFRDRPRTLGRKRVASSKHLSKIWDPLILRLTEILSKEPRPS